MAEYNVFDKGSQQAVDLRLDDHYFHGFEAVSVDVSGSRDESVLPFPFSRGFGGLRR